MCVLGQSLTCVPRQAKQSLSNSDIPFTFVLLSAPNKPTFVIFSAHKIQSNLFLKREMFITMFHVYDAKI